MAEITKRLSFDIEQGNHSPIEVRTDSSSDGERRVEIVQGGDAIWVKLDAVGLLQSALAQILEAENNQ